MVNTHCPRGQIATNTELTNKQQAREKLAPLDDMALGTQSVRI